MRRDFLVALFLLSCLSAPPLPAQRLPGGMILPAPPRDQNAAAGKPRVIVRESAPPPGEYVVHGTVQEVDGPSYRLRGSASIESSELLIEADEIDYNADLKFAEARGHVHFVSFDQGEELWAERVEYDFNKQHGNFYKVRGSIPAKIDPRPGILTTGNPFLFKGDWAERIEDRYLLYRGTLTNCTWEEPWWTLDGERFDIVPGGRAIADKSIFKMRRVPMLYAPKFYKSLSEQTRRSGFLTPNFGNSNRRGLMFGLGYYWAINRSYDLQYRPQYFTQRGFAHTIDFRGRPTQKSDFNFYLYGVDDKGLLLQDGSRRKEGGYLLSATGRSDWGRGFYSRAAVNYLSNFRFRQAFTESFNEAVFSEVNSIFFTSKEWDTYHLSAVYAEQDNFLSDAPGDKISIRRLPSFEFSSRDRTLTRNSLPVWFSWDTSAGFVRRNQPQFQTRRFVERFDLSPRISAALRWKQIHLVPWFSLRETYYGSSFHDGQVVGRNYNRFSREAGVELVLPSLGKVYRAPSWSRARLLKHTIETRAQFRHVGGIDEFERAVRFDQMEIVSNTNEVEIMVANRFWSKTASGEVRDFLTWELSQRHFFDSTFGGALVPGVRNVLSSSAQMSGYTFMAEPRNYSPVVSVLRAQPRPAFGLEWRTDYDPLRAKFVNSSVSADARLSSYFFSIGHNKVSCVPLAGLSDPERNPCAGTPVASSVLSPVSNQLRGLVGLGQESRRGWNAAFLAIYDYKTGVMQYANTQITYNTSCCAYSFQYRRFAFGTRNENQFRVAFVIANIGSFGTLKRQERLF